MSLYSDLNEVLTPYANKIKGLANSDDQIKANLSELQEGGYIADQQKIQEKIDGWLEDHPEAVAAIPDGAIGKTKLDTELLKSYRANGSVMFFFPSLASGGYSGNCSLVVTPTKTILMDCGPDTDWTAIKTYFDKLYNAGIFTNIDVIVISHYHYDHVDGLDDILSTYPHDNCHAYIPLNPEGYGASTSSILSKRTFVLDTLTQNAITYTEVNVDTNVTIDQDFVSMKLFNSSPADYSHYSGISAVYNNYSMVTLFTIGNVHAMFPGDLQHDGQVRVLSNHDLPRLFLYCVHHHGIQNDDYIPYLDAISPEYSVIMTSHNRALQSAASSFSGNYLLGDVGSTGFSHYEYVAGKDGGSIVSGVIVPKIGWLYSYVNLYVDNSYDGTIHDGTEEHPFTEINEAVMFVNQSANLHYRIRVKGTVTRYEYLWLRDINTAMEIIGVAGDGNVLPSVEGVYARNCNNIEISKFNIDGTGRTVNDRPSLVYVWATNAFALSNCTLDGANIADSGTKRGLQLREAHAYTVSNTIKNVGVGVDAYREGSITASANSFINITSSCYITSNMSLCLKGLDSVTNCSKWITGNPDTGRPFVCTRSSISTALLALNTSSAISEVFYNTTTNPVCVCQGTKVYNVLSGEEVILS